jgi:hypothetical protein
MPAFEMPNCERKRFERKGKKGDYSLINRVEVDTRMCRHLQVPEEKSEHQTLIKQMPKPMNQTKNMKGTHLVLAK